MSTESSGQSAQSAQVQMATIEYNVYQQPGPFVGKTVAEVRKTMAPQMSMPEDAAAYKGKERLSDDYIIQAGDHLKFSRVFGEKG